MDMTNSTPGTGVMSMMTPYLHFTGGDYLFFKSLTPTSRGAIAGACIVLGLLAILERIMSAARGTMESYWRQEILTMTAARLSGMSEHTVERADSKGDESVEDPRETIEVQTVPILPATRRASRRARLIAPFIAAHDIPRGIFYALQALLAYILMLAVMTFHAAYIIAIIVGLGIGEMLFGRFAFVQ